MRSPLTTLLLMSLLVILASPGVQAQETDVSDDQGNIVQLGNLSFEQHPCIEVTQANLGSKYWRDMLKKLRGTPHTEKWKLSVFHVTQEYPTKRAPIIGLGTIVKHYMPRSGLSGGGAFCKVDSGQVIIWHHINGNPKVVNTIRIGHAASGTIDLTTQTPPPTGQPRCYDVYLKVCPKDMRGQLLITLNKRSSVKCSSFTINMLANGGIYGIDYDWPFNNNRPIELAPGNYKFLFRQIDQRNGRFDFQIKPGVTTKLNFKAPSQNAIQLVSQSFTPAANAKK